MSNMKRRKLSTTENSQLSAFAIRRTLKSKVDKISAEAHDSNAPILDSIAVKESTDHKLNVERQGTWYSTFVPNDKNFQKFPDGSKSLSIAPGERLVVVGQYEILVHKGEVSLLGAILKPSKRWRVFAPPSCSIPVIRCPRESFSNAELSLHPFESGFEKLKLLSPLFRSPWDDFSESAETQCKKMFPEPKLNKFQILLSSYDECENQPLHTLVLPPEWNLAFSSCLEASLYTRKIFVCGPKSSGKSTFAKILVNRFLSRPSTTAEPIGVALLDLDPGQPEFSPPGLLSLIHILEPNLGPSFSHPIPGFVNKCLRAHSIGAISPTLDPSFYKSCALDLFSEYNKFLSRNPTCPLVINTPGWILGTGLEILVSLIESVKPTQIVYMSQDGPPEVVESLHDVDETIKLLTLPSQICENSNKTAAHLRKMQYISYFHLVSHSENSLSWDSYPITSFKPWEIKYSGDSPGVLGIICYGEIPPDYLLAETLNGSLVSVVVVEDMIAIPCSQVNDEKIRNKKYKNQEEHLYFNMTYEKPLIIRTSEDLPFFNPKNQITLDPKYSHCIGLALVRGIDVSRRRLQVITPISGSLIESIQDSQKYIILVYGKLDTPGWAYTEQFVQESAREKVVETSRKIGQSPQENSNKDINDIHGRDNFRLQKEKFQEIPWVEKLEDHHGRSLGSFVWRVRRDLGKLF